MKKTLCFCLFVIMALLSAPMPGVLAEAGQAEPLPIKAVGVSGGTFASDEDSFSVARNPDYGSFVFDENIADFVTDGDPSTFWESTGNHGRNPTNPDKSEYIILDLGDIKKITRVELTASAHGGFPERMSCEYAVSQMDIKYNLAGSTKTLTEAPGSGEKISLVLDETVARYLIVNIVRVFRHTTYSALHGQDIFDACVSDVTVFGTEATQEEKDAAIRMESNRIMTTPKIDSFMIDVSSVLDTKYEDGTYAYDPSNLLDGSLTTLWYNSFSATASEICSEYVMIQTTDSETADFRELVLYSMPSRDFFPKDFVIQYSFDGLNWLDIAGQSYTDYTDNPTGEGWTKIENVKHYFIFGEPVIAQYLRIYVTKKSGAFDAALNDTYYMIALSEVEILACEADPADARDAEADFWDKVAKKNGNEQPVTIEIVKDTFIETLFIVLIALCFSAGIAVTLSCGHRNRRRG